MVECSILFSPGRGEGGIPMGLKRRTTTGRIVQTQLCPVGSSGRALNPLCDLELPPLPPRPKWTEHWELTGYVPSNFPLWTEDWQGGYTLGPEQFTEHWEFTGYVPSTEQFTEHWEFTGYVLGPLEFTESWEFTGYVPSTEEFTEHWEFTGYVLGQNEFTEHWEFTGYVLGTIEFLEDWDSMTETPFIQESSVGSGCLFFFAPYIMPSQ